jgi:hypothetical protein
MSNRIKDVMERRGPKTKGTGKNGGHPQEPDVALNAEEPVVDETPIWERSPEPDRRSSALPPNAGAGPPIPKPPQQSIPWIFAGPNLALNAAASFVQRLLFRDSVSVVFGESTAGKSFWLLDLALHVAMGWKWRGFGVQRGAVVYICLEGESGFKKRIVGLCQRKGITEDIPIVVRCIPLNIWHGGPDPVIEWVRNEIAPAVHERWGIPVNWIIVDTLSQELAGQKEDNETFARIVADGRRIANALDVEATFVHHPGKNFEAGSRGGYALKANINTEIEIRKEDGFSVAKTLKVKDGPDGDEFPFKLDVVDLGVFDQWDDEMTTCVVEHLPTTVLGDRKPKELKGQSLDAITILRKCAGKDGIYCTDIGLVDDEIPTDRKLVTEETWWQACLDGGCASGNKDRDGKKKAFNRAVQNLREDGHVIVRKGYAWTTA